MWARHGAGGLREHGFTLIELIVVLAVLALTFSLLLDRGPGQSQTVEFDSFVRRTAGTLRLARARSIADDRLVPVIFTARSVQLDRDQAILLPQHVALTGSHIINFAPDGGSSGGEITLRAGHRAVVIEVDWLTGRVALSTREFQG